MFQSIYGKKNVLGSGEQDSNGENRTVYCIGQEKENETVCYIGQDGENRTVYCIGQDGENGTV